MIDLENKAAVANSTALHPRLPPIYQISFGSFLSKVASVWLRLLFMHHRVILLGVLARLLLGAVLEAIRL